MWLLNALTLELESFINKSDTPDYAILSHTWGNDEVKIKDLTDLPREQLERKKAYQKVQKCAEMALEWGLEWIWIDTCCIDQQSSAELSEAINSMYQWYQQSAVCFAYLNDAYCVEDDFKSDSRVGGEQWHRILSFDDARWFTRGWCLQELLAPRNMQFFNANWECIGSKDSLKTHISRVTGIDEYGLFIPDLSVLSVAHRMTWAANRQTSRPEDMAYCLLGIFNINMPLLYGEGQVRAFGRLQEEIMERTEDHSIFAWSGVGTDFGNDMVGFLAPDPSKFTYGRVDLCELPQQREPLSITGRGIRAQVPLIRQGGTGENYLVVIGCNEFGSSETCYAIPVTRIKESSDVYRRRSPDLQTVSIEEAKNATLSTIFLLRHSRPTHLEDNNTTQVWLSLLEMNNCFYKIHGTFPSRLWNDSRRVFAFSSIDFFGPPQLAIGFKTANGERFGLVIDLDVENGISSELYPPRREKFWEERPERWLASLVGKERLPRDSERGIVHRKHSVWASVDQVVVFEQELFEVKVRIGKLPGV